MDGFPVFCGCCVAFNAQTMSTAQNFVGWRVEESTVGDYRGSAGNTCLMTFCVKFEKDGKKINQVVTIYCLFSLKCVSG